ncbi:metallophosphoesterase family protein [Oceanidesulfovibrio marinus]|uniref:Serine/threonine protein phosphatase n=1 Tax=Oceanidesulfovibrio marinus TaxID=370038 RepID=A0A6P1ZFE0_9BACT|nr:metallophosphoesterase family protein [Oceanidesulfovibrio marinus]TVM31522.1 serine/threonine protein phosphatase [Oceanidesulfovibrio marinus]
MEQRIFAVGDIHGTLGKLRTLLDRLPVTEQDTVVFMGDYINRGPDAKGVIDLLLEFRAHHPDTVFLLGNHEYELLEYAHTHDTEHLQTLRRLGVEATLESYGDAPVSALRDLSFMPAEHAVFLEELLPFYRQDGYLFVHGGVTPGCTPEECPLDVMLALRGSFLTDPWQGPETVVFGHTSFQTPFVAERKIGIDTGAVLGNLLTAVELPRLRFYHA